MTKIMVTKGWNCTRKRGSCTSLWPPGSHTFRMQVYSVWTGGYALKGQKILRLLRIYAFKIQAISSCDIFLFFFSPLFFSSFFFYDVKSNSTSEPPRSRINLFDERVRVTQSIENEGNGRRQRDATKIRRFLVIIKLYTRAARWTGSPWRYARVILPLVKICRFSCLKITVTHTFLPFIIVASFRIGENTSVDASFYRNSRTALTISRFSSYTQYTCIGKLWLAHTKE